MKGRLARLSLVLAGVTLGQAVLYGPSLAGRKILLPVDILTAPRIFIPRRPEIAAIQPQNTYLIDQVYQFEPERRFAVSEVRAGRLPMWAPYHFAGVPFIVPKFSPLLALQHCIASPVVLAWTQLLQAIVAGLGAYLFCRRVLAVGYWPSAIGAWCYPLTGFFVLWQGYPPALPVAWLPCILLAVENTVRGRTLTGSFAFSILTCVVLLSGHLDVAGQVLLVAGLYALWRLLGIEAGPLRSRPGRRPRDRASDDNIEDAKDEGSAQGHQSFAGKISQAAKPAVRLVLSWVLGFLLAAPYSLPVLDYTRTGARMERRAAGEEERPPVGIAALPQIVLPEMYGMGHTGSLRFVDGNAAESSAATYTGILATLLLAPLAWCSRRHRSLNVFWLLLSILALSWCLNIPGVVSVLRLPGLNMLSHNRFVFAASFAILAMTAVGLEVLAEELIRWRGWFWFPTALLAGLGVWCAYRAVVLPWPIRIQLPSAVMRGEAIGWVNDAEGVQTVQRWFMWSSLCAAVLCVLGVGGWLILRARRTWQPRLLPLAGAGLVADLLCFAQGQIVQCDPALYFPQIPVFKQIAHAHPGRVMGYDCLPAALASMAGLRDVRGYDAVDPAAYCQLLMQAAEPDSLKPSYASTQWLKPKMTLTDQGEVRLSPVLDMLGVRYVVFRGAPLPEARPVFQGFDYWVLRNPAALERAFIPRQVEVLTNRQTCLQALASPQFDPRKTAFLESPINLPDPARGEVEIVSEIPTRIILSVRMETPGLVVLADLWDKGWRAFVDGKPAPILRANYALRGVVVPAVSRTLEFRYQPASFVWGLRLAALAALLLLAWLARAWVSSSSSA